MLLAASLSRCPAMMPASVAPEPSAHTIASTEATPTVTSWAEPLPVTSTRHFRASGPVLAPPPKIGGGGGRKAGA